MNTSRTAAAKHLRPTKLGASLMLVLAMTACGGGKEGAYDYPTARTASAFGTSGTTYVANPRPLGTTTTAFSADVIAVDAQDRIVVAGARWQGDRQGWLTRLNANGSVDTTCGNAGWQTWTTGGPAIVRSLKVLADGRMMVGGRAGGTGAWFFKSDCTPDVSMGPGGFVAFDEAVSLSTVPELIAIAQDPSTGRIAMAVAGTVLLIEPNGTRVSSFGTNGVANFVFSDGSSLEPSDIQFLQDGALLLGGATDYGLADGQYAGFAKLKADGSLDTSYGDRGAARWHIAGNQIASPAGMAVFSDGSALLTGLAMVNTVSTLLSNAFWVSAGPTGASVGFGGKGQAIWDAGGGNSSVSYPGSKLIVTRRTEVAGCQYWLNNSGADATSKTAVERGLLQLRNRDGSTVTGFGDDGTVTVATGCSGVAERADGNFVVLGRVVSANALADNGFNVAVVLR